MSIFVPRPPAEAKAGPIGAGAGVLNTEFLLPMVLPVDQQQRMAKAVRLGTEVAYIRSAEQTISSKIADPLMGVAWHLEDPDGETIDETYKDPKAREAYELVSHPQAALDPKEVGVVYSRNEMWEITSRHMGLCGNAAWYGEGLNTFGIPRALMYIRPDRLEAKKDGQVLRSWVLDKRPGNPNGTPLDIDEVFLFTLETPNDGVFASGLIESAMNKAILQGQIDKHFIEVLSGGGRLSGILAPKADAITDDGVFGQIVRDWRNVTEQPESARRLQVVRAPVEFIKTVLTPQEMALIDLMTRNRDDLLALWRVPLSQIGGSTPAGLNSGDVRKYDEAALWQNAVTPRLSRMSSVIQGILDRFGPYIGWAPKLVFDIPEFDDDSPRYDKVQKAQFIALTNRERRELIGFEPLDDKVLGATGSPLNDEVWMPISLMPIGKPPMAKPDVMPKRVLAPAWSSEAADIVQPGPSQIAQGEAAPGATMQGPAQNVSTPTAPARGGYVRPGKAKVDALPAVLAVLRKQWPDTELDIVREGEWTYVDSFPMKKINATRRPVPRNPKIVAGVEAEVEVGAPLKPVVLIHTKVLGKPGYTPIDGWHHTLAYEHAGIKKTPAYVGEGDADWTTELLKFNDEIPTPPDGPDDTGKARLDGFRHSFTALRSNLTERVTPQLRGAVSLVLDQQRRDVIARVRTQYDKIKARPKDTTLWWPRPAEWNSAMTAALQPSLGGVAEQVRAHVTDTFRDRPQKAGLLAPAGAVAHVLQRGAARVTDINETTRTALADLILQGLDEGMGPAELADAIEAASVFDDYRSELIARTELMDAYNAAALGSYDEVGIQMVEALDGDEDELCAQRVANNPYTLEQADAEVEHPNGTLDWIPVIGEA